MKTLSIWAAKNRKLAIAAIVILHVILIVTGIILGEMIFNEGIVLKDHVLYLSVFLFLIAFFFYPVRAGKKSFRKYDLKSKIFKYSYLRHKLLDAIIALSSLLLIIYLANISYSNKGLQIWFIHHAQASDRQVQNINNSQKSAVYKFKNIETGFQKIKKSRLKSYNKHIITTKFYRFKKKITPKSYHLFLKIALIILIISLSLGLTYLLAILACSIACSGFEFLAGFVFLGGLSGIILLSIFFIKKIIRKKEFNHNIKKYEEQ